MKNHEYHYAIEKKKNNYDVVMLAIYIYIYVYVSTIVLIKDERTITYEVLCGILVVIIYINTHTHLPVIRNVYPSMDPFGWLTVIIFNFYRSS